MNSATAAHKCSRLPRKSWWGPPCQILLEVPGFPLTPGDAQGTPTGHYLLVIIIETIRWLLVLSIHSALFAVTNTAKLSII